MDAFVFSCPKVDKQVIRQALSVILVQYDIKPALVPNGHPDLAAKIKLFLAGKKLEGLSPLTLEAYALELRIFSEHINKATDEVTTSDIRLFLGGFDHLKTSSVSKKLSVLKSMFGWLANEGVISKDVTKQIKPPKKEKRSPKALTIEELEMIREACITPRERAMIEVYYATGARLTEVQKLNRQDIDYQAMSVLVVGKGDKERTVYFSFKAMYHLKKYLMRRTDDVDALFVTERRPYRRLSTKGIQRAVKRIAARSEVTKNVHTHVFRHTFATLMLNNGADLVAVQGLLGHVDPATTLIYSVLSDEKRKQAYKQYLVQ
ncbi:MAG: integrase [Desulfosporosinus sp. BRH_c37]|nr:MAG: integrase [Desulfosporosinus sp. BRH_c37]